MTVSLKSNIEKTIKEPISDSDYKTFRDFMFEKTFDKRDFLIEEGTLCNYVYFIEEGSAYSFIMDNKGDKHAIQFALEGYWISDLYSFYSGRNSIYSIEA